MRIIDADSLKEKLCILGEHRIERLVDKEPTVCDIEQIRDEIEKQSIADFIAVSTVIEIIDKYTKGE